jgi:hypothetical protein
MSEQSSTDIGAFEDRLIELLYGLDEDGEVNDFFVDIYSERSKEQTVARINALSETLGVRATAWTEACVGGTWDNLYDSTSINRVGLRHIRLQGTSVGEYLLESSFDVLPIEMQEEGDGQVRLSLAISDERILTLHSQSSFDTTYPEDEDSDEESELGFDITFEASVHKITP